MSKSFLFRLRAKDTPTGISEETLRALCEQTGLNKTCVIHLALRLMAENYRIVQPEPHYELDDGPLTEEQIARIQAHADASMKRAGVKMPPAGDPRWKTLF